MDLWSSLPTKSVFTDKNYQFGVFKIETLFWLEDIWYLVENLFAKLIIQCLIKAQPYELKATMKRDALALYFISEALDDSNFYKIAKANTSKKVWDILKIIHDERSNPNLCQLGNIVLK